MDKHHPAMLYIENPTDQEVVVQWEHTGKWNLPAACDNKKLHMEYYIYMMTGHSNSFNVSKPMPTDPHIQMGAKH